MEPYHSEDGNDDDPTTAISVNGRLIIPGRVRIDSVVTSRGDSMKLRIDPIPGSEVIRDLIVDHWALERKRESSRPWMVVLLEREYRPHKGSSDQ